MKVCFLGACGEVGRSAVMLEDKGKRILLDCGVKLGDPKEYPLLDERIARSLKAVFVTHAHLDHSGFLPDLERLGFRGKVYSTKPTFDLVQVLLADYYRLGVAKKDINFSRNDVKKILSRFSFLEYKKPVRVAGFEVTAYNAGHILGAAGFRVKKGRKSLYYTGDMNTRETNLLYGAEKKIPRTDYLITESTYSGPDDLLPSLKTVSRELAEIIRSTPGKVLIPVFGVGRGQEVMMIIDNYVRSGFLSNEHGYADGMVKKASRIYRHNVLWLKEEIPRRILLADDDPFKSRFWKTPRTKDRRDVLEKERAIIVSTSGMLTGGPSVYYLKKLAGDKDNSVILVGYQAEGTLGRQISEGARNVIIGDEEVEIKLRVHQLRLSAHADRNDLLNWIKENHPREQVFLVHGEKEKQKSFSRTLEKKGIQNSIPEPGEEIVI